MPPEDFSNIIECLRGLPDLTTELQLVLEYIRPNFTTVVQNYVWLCRDLEHVLNEVLPGCSVHPFGSTITGLCFTTSDVDAYVLLSYRDRTVPTTTVLNRSKKALYKSRLFTNVVSIPKANTPIVKCVHVPTRISCDFNFKNMLGVLNSKLITYYLSLDPRLTSIMISLKLWAKVKELSGPNRFSNYSLAMMFIFYLQQAPYFFPPVHVLQEDPRCVNMQEGWNGGFKPVENFCDEAIRNATPNSIISGFFDYYSKFDFVMDVICPFTGGVMAKTDFFETADLPPLYERYKTNVANSYPLRVETAVCLQDPFELNRNTTCGVSTKILEDFIIHCKTAVEIFHTNESDLLYNVLKKTPNYAALQKYTITDNSRTFGFPMSVYLYHLYKKIETKSKENIRKAWYDLVVNFVQDVLKKILKFNIKMCNPSDVSSKFQKLNEQVDVHDTDVVDTVTFQCTTKFNLWEPRKAMARDAKLNLPPEAKLLDREVALTDFVCGAILEKLTVTDNFVEFNLVCSLQKDPAEVFFLMERTKGEKHPFKTLCTFLASKVPHWFDVYARELHKECQTVNN